MSQARSDARSVQRTPQRIKLRTSLNRFELDMSRVPPGMTVEWKRKSVFGKEDRENMVNCEANGWTPVPADRHPEMAGKRAVAGEEIVRGGLIAMERPVELTEESREMDRVEAANLIGNQMRKLRMDGHRAAGSGIRSDYEPIPED